MNPFMINFGDSPESTLAQAQQADALIFCNLLIDGWHDLEARRASQEAMGKYELPIKAYLLLETWADNPLAADLQAHYPLQAQMRQHVPDELFKNREDESPCLVPLPAALAPQARQDTVAAATAREALVNWLLLAGQQTRQRHVGQQLCGVIMSDAEPETITRHWVDLGYQQPPDGSGARLFRYQDPRVMQRAWPYLPANQKKAWLGPVTQWWALTQPWGPWDPEAFASGEVAATDVPGEWFCTDYPMASELYADTSRCRLRALFTPEQWQVAHITPDANSVWKGYAADRIAADQQPDGNTVSRLLTDAARLGLDGSNLHEYVWCTWRHTAKPGTLREAPWASEPGIALMQKILKVLRQQPEARFASVYGEIMAVSTNKTRER